MKGPESFKNSPKLPEDMTAQQLLDEVSENDRATIAQSQGVSLQEFERFLNTEARKQRVSGYISEVGGTLNNEPMERNENDLKAEHAVIRGLEEVISSIDNKTLSAEKVEGLENEAYKLIDQASGERNNIKAAGIRRRAESIFKKATLSQALSEISERGSSKETIADIVNALRERSSRQNIREFSSALYDVINEIMWGATNSPLTEVRQLVSSYKAGNINEEQKVLLRRLAKYGKSAHISTRDVKIEADLKRFENLLDDVAVGYRKYGPHRTEASSVSGPSEVYGSYQSDKVSGYRSDSKRRPHRDPSGGNGEPS